MKYLFYLGVFIVFNFNSYGQQSKPISNSFNKKLNVPNDFCGTDEIHREKLKSDREYRLRHSQTIENIKQAQLVAKSIVGIYQVPVVVHVMHKGEPIGEGTNISDADVIAGIQYLNNFWRKISGTNGDGNGVDMEIEFALAVQDENGDCTNGIDRVDMSNIVDYVDYGIDYNGDGLGIPDHDGDTDINSLKEYSNWDPTKYYNVWLVDEISNANCYSGGTYTAGYAYYASEHGQPWDGSVVLICSYLDESNETWAHEMGHALNLPHTFDGDDVVVDETYTCGEDYINDTPQHIRTMYIDGLYNDCDNDDINDCDSNFNLQMSPTHVGNGTHQDHMHNYMDYTGCASEFTSGQRDVSKDALTNERASYLPENGNTALVPPAIAEVDFSSSRTIGCNGMTVKFTDQSSCTPNTYLNEPINGITFNWQFDNGQDTPLTSTDQNPTITFDNSGNYDVTLEITNIHGTSSLTKSELLIVSDDLDEITINMFDSYGDGGGEVTVGGVTATNTGASSATSVCVDLSACNLVDYEATDSWSYENSWSIIDASGAELASGADSDGEFGACSFTESGCADLLACNYDATLTPDTDNSLCNYSTDLDECATCSGETDGTGTIVDNDIDDDGICDADDIVGCQDSVACNYDADAIEPGNCIYADDNCEMCYNEDVLLYDDDGDGVCDFDEIVGCQESDACNYNPLATDEGDCIYADDNCEICDNGAVLFQDDDGDGVCDFDEILGCQEFDACNYNADATDAGDCTFIDGFCETCDNGVIIDNDSDDDGICDEFEVPGCQDIDACNFNENATDDDASCVFIVDACDTCSGQTDGTGTIIDNDSDDDGVCDADEILGCQDLIACNYDPSATDSGDCIYADDNCEICDNGVVLFQDDDGDGVCNANEIVGCQDPLAANYSLFSTEAGFCEYPGCTDSDYLEYDPDANLDDGSCEILVIYGCMITTALNFNPFATINDGSCIIILEGCIDPLYVEYNENATIDDGSCAQLVILGCTDINYVEFYPPANTDDGSCENIVDGGCIDEMYIEFNPEATVDDGSCETLIVEGCMDDFFAEFNSEANVDDGSCEVEAIIGCMDVNGTNYNQFANVNAPEGHPFECVYWGCIDPTAFNYDEYADVDDGSCIPFIEGCMNDNYIEYNPEANISDNSCVNIIFEGCTDEAAVNFNEFANFDDGSCIEWVEGCMDAEYLEFSAEVTVDDGSCLTPIVLGCIDEDAANTNLYANTDDGSCIYLLLIVEYDLLGVSTYEFEVEVVSMEDYALLWDFGDGSYSSLDQVVHTYESNGTYTVTITASNSQMALVEELTIDVNIPGLSVGEIQDDLLNEFFTDLLGRKCIHPNRGSLYIRTREYESGKKIRDKYLYND